jgi:uncharacterized protein
MGMSVIVKPTHECNLQCTYCYVLDEAERGRMSDQTLRRTIEEVVENSEDSVNFIWHGGEPLLMGLDFFKKIKELQSPYQKKTRISNGIQTNGTLVNQDLIDFIAKARDFYLGFSLDGPKCVSDLTRRGHNSEGAFEKIFNGIRLAKQSRAYVGDGAIAVLNKKNLKHLAKIYNFFNRERIPLKLNHIIDINDSKHGISPRSYANSMICLFDEWFQDQDAIEVDPFTQIIGNLLTGSPSGCNFRRSCRGDFISIGPQGDIYPCGRFDGNSKYKMGNINERGGLKKALKSEVELSLRKRGEETMPSCKPCEYLTLCYSGCPHNALVGGDISRKDPFCEGYKSLYSHIKLKLLNELKK